MVRGAAALELIRWLVSAENMAELAAATQMLPTRTQALGSWSVGADGEAFVGQLLDSSVRALPPSVDTPVRRALQAGLTALLLQEVDSPEAAASTALTIEAVDTGRSSSVRFVSAATMRAADLVITKGQGNFETLNEYDRPIFFLFRAKCAIIVKFLGNVPMGSMQVVAANIN